MTDVQFARATDRRSATPTTPKVRKRPTAAARRVGYVIAVLVNVAMLYGVNRWPGWDAVPFLTTDFERVLRFVNASMLVSLAANALYLARDPRWLRALGDGVVAAVGVASSARIWQVFPFDASSGWELVLRILLGTAIAGSAIAVVVGLVGFARGLTTSG